MNETATFACDRISLWPSAQKEGGSLTTIRPVVETPPKRGDVITGTTYSKPESRQAVSAQHTRAIMALFLVSFRLKNDRTYAQRYESLVTAVSSLTQSRWEEGTALYILLYNGTAEALKTHLLLQSQLYRNGDDLLVAVEIDIKSIAAIGAQKLEMLKFIAMGARMPTTADLRALGVPELPKLLPALGSRR